MVKSLSSAGRLATGAVGATVVAGALLFGALPAANAATAPVPPATPAIQQVELASHIVPTGHMWRHGAFHRGPFHRGPFHRGPFHRGPFDRGPFDRGPFHEMRPQLPEHGGINIGPQTAIA